MARAVLGGQGTVRTLALLVNLLPLAALAGERGPALELSSLPEPRALAALLWERAPALQPPRLRLASARAEAERTHLLPNPGLDVSWNTIPIGATNPPDLAHPLSSVPNYAVSVSGLVEIGKRGPRQRAAADAMASTLEEARAALFDAYFDLQEKVGTIAAAQVRIRSLEELAADAQRLTEIQQARAEKGDAARLDVDRSAIEEESLWTALADERGKLASGLRECAALAGVACAPFASGEAAGAFLARRNPASAGLERRPDLRSLELQAAAARESLDLANARAIPDPTLRFGYVRDQFTVAGNQANSVFLGASFPLTVFDHGQAEARLARATLEASGRSRELLLEQGRAQLAKLGEEQAAVEERRTRMREKTLPLARSVVNRLEEIVRRGGAPLQELLLARRTLGELTVAAAALDLSAQQLDVTSARVRGEGPPTPSELSFVP